MGLFRQLANMLRRTRPSDHGGRVRSGYGGIEFDQEGNPHPAGVTETEALSVPTYNCCVRVISESISQMPWHCLDGRQEAFNHPADRLLSREPNPVHDPAVWREMLLRWLLTWGNAYCEIVRDISGRPSELWPIEPWRVVPFYTSHGLAYEVWNPDGPINLPAVDMLHFRGLGDDLEGYSVLRMMARTLKLSSSQEESMAATMANGARPSGVLSPKAGSLNKTKATEIADLWKEQNTGAKKHGKVILLNEGLDFHMMTIPNSDAQLLESRQFSVLDVCRFLRVPPHKVYELSRATFSNITHQSLEFLMDSLGPWIVKLEQQADRKLISKSNRGRFVTKINPRSVLRMDPQTRVEYFTKMRDLGALNANEIREQEDMDGIGQDGDAYFVPANLVTLEKAVADDPEPEPPPVPAIAPADQISDPMSDEEPTDGGR